ncbi:acyl-CoA dehydrogenase C-terminal domain-containing protein, partial [Lysobacter xanthus]
ALAYWWARSVAAVREGAPSPAFADAKRATARFYFDRLLPRTFAHVAAIRSGATPLMALDATAFDAGR